MLDKPVDFSEYQFMLIRILKKYLSFSDVVLKNICDAFQFLKKKSNMKEIIGNRFFFKFLQISIQMACNRFESIYKLSQALNLRILADFKWQNLWI